MINFNCPFCHCLPFCMSFCFVCGHLYYTLRFHLVSLGIQCEFHARPNHVRGLGSFSGHISTCSPKTQKREEVHLSLDRPLILKEQCPWHTIMVVLKRRTNFNFNIRILIGNAAVGCLCRRGRRRALPKHKRRSLLISK